MDYTALFDIFLKFAEAKRLSVTIACQNPSTNFNQGKAKASSEDKTRSTA